jgi:tRNA pseudouridine55 synthase
VAEPCGILLLDKPLGLSSNAALQRVRRAFNGAKAGHTGSLDPLASGMLPICIGEATKLAGELLAGRKCYRFTVQLGETRTTGDAEGAVLQRCAIPALEKPVVQAVLARLVGPQQQVPPMYSALKRDGQPLYKLARQGIEVERAARGIEIYSLELLAMTDGQLELRALCSKGTYVRTLGEQIATDLGSCGYLAMLRREFVQPFEGQSMITLDALQAATGLVPLLAADAAVPHLVALHLDAAAAAALCHGQVVRRSEAMSGTVRLYDAAQRFFGLGELEGGQLRVRRLFATGQNNADQNSQD